jgi:hypothetical protein
MSQFQPPGWSACYSALRSTSSQRHARPRATLRRTSRVVVVWFVGDGESFTLVALCTLARRADGSMQWGVGCVVTRTRATVEAHGAICDVRR